LLAIKVLSGNHLPEEPEELRRQIAAHEPYRAVFEKLSVYWRADTQLAINEEAALDKVWNRIGQAGTPVIETPRILRWKRLLAAAILLPLIALSIWLFTHPSPRTELVEKYNQKGIRSIIILPDGSKIWLNADSRLKYPASFPNNLREVYLEGEAFFEIAKNPQRPFIVHLPKGNVQVLGTSFDIRAYGDEELMSTSVATGLVAFVPDAAGRNNQRGAATQPAADSVYLTPNHKAVYDFQSGKINVAPTDAEADRGWINGIMTFSNESLGRIATELERAFGKPIKFRSVAIAQYRYTATFKNNTEEEILSTLRRVKSFHFTVTDKFIEINK
jgi:ferric-dicitrate binding protein FerR (iron transport regulator)